MSLILELYRQNSKAKFFSFLALLSVFLFGIILRLEALSEVTLNEWIFRDFERAFNIVDGNYFPLAGPETDLGGRLPGPFMYIFLAFPLLINYSYESLFIFNFILNIISIIVFFLIIRKTINFYVAALASGFLSINLYHIGAVNFPFNPSFIFPFVAAAIGLLFELVEKQSSKRLPLLIGIIGLTVQFHYSTAMLLAVTVFLILIFKIKISAKTWTITLITTLLCLSPFAVYKAKTVAPLNTGGTFTFKDRQPISPLSIVKMAGAQNTIARIANSKRAWNGRPVPKPIQLAWRLTLSLTLYGLLFYVIRKSRAQGMKSCSKEISVVALFYLPALIYEVVRPNTIHYWYSFIFVIPQALMMSIALHTMFQSISARFTRITLAALSATIVSLAYFSYHYSRSFADPPNGSFTDYYGYKYRTSSIILKEFIKTLRLSPREFYDRVFLPNYRPASLKRLELIAATLPAFQQEETDKGCYFIIDPQSNHKKALRNRSEFNQLIEEKFLTIENTQPVIIAEGGLSKIFMVFKYRPNHRQSCFNNSFNAFPVTRNDRDLLQQGKKLSRASHFVLSFDKLLEKEKYDDKKELVFFEGKYIVFNTHTEIPFRFRLIINKQTRPYYLRGEIENHYPFAIPNFRMKTLAVNLVLSDSYKFEILPEQRLTNFPWGIANQFDQGFNKWFREVPIPDIVNLKAGKFKIELEWDIEWTNISDAIPNPIAPPKCCASVQKNRLNLK